MPTQQYRQEQRDQAFHLFQGGKTVSDISGKMRIPAHRIYKWLSTRLGGKTTTYKSRCKGKLCRMYRALGYSTGETGKMIGLSHCQVVQLLKRDPWGEPNIMVRIDGLCRDRDGRNPEIKTYAKLTWSDNRGGLLEMNKSKETYLINWCDLRGNVAPVGRA